MRGEIHRITKGQQGFTGLLRVFREGFSLVPDPNLTPDSKTDSEVDTNIVSDMHTDSDQDKLNLNSYMRF